MRVYENNGLWYMICTESGKIHKQEITGEALEVLKYFQSLPANN